MEAGSEASLVLLPAQISVRVDTVRRPGGGRNAVAHSVFPEALMFQEDNVGVVFQEAACDQVYQVCFFPEKPWSDRSASFSRQDRSKGYSHTSYSWIKL